MRLPRRPRSPKRLLILSCLAAACCRVRNARALTRPWPARSSVRHHRRPAWPVSCGNPVARLGSRAHPSVEPTLGDPKLSPRALTAAIVKNIIGAGILCFPSVVAAGTGVVPSCALIILLALGSGYTFSIVGQLSGALGCTTSSELYELAWGGRRALWLSAGLFLLLFLGCVMLTMMLTSLTAPYSPMVSGHAVLVTLLLVPIALQKDLDSLKLCNRAGLISVFYTVGVMLFRLVDGSYSAGGSFVQGAALRSVQGGASPLAFTKFGLFHLTAQSFNFLSVCNINFLAHGNVPRYYEEMEKTQQGAAADRRRFHRIALGSFSLAAALCIAVALAGIWTFRGAEYLPLVGARAGAGAGGIGLHALVLNNYARGDVLAQIAVLATVPSVIACWAAVFLGLKDSMKSMAWMAASGSASPARERLLSLGLLGLCGLIALVTPSLGRLVAVRGALLGSLFVFVAPAALRLKLGGRAGIELGRGERLLAWAVLAYGLVSCVLGTLFALLL